VYQQLQQRGVTTPAASHRPQVEGAVRVVMSPNHMLRARRMFRQIVASARSWLMASILCLALACGPARLERERLADGSTIADLASRSRDVLVLVYDPSHCFGCNRSLAQWLLLPKVHDRTVAVVLSRQPTNAEQRQVVVYRLPVAGALRSGFSDGKAGMPAALLFRDGHLIAGGRLADARVVTSIKKGLGLI
jgi:hypothetical protein